MRTLFMRCGSGFLILNDGEISQNISDMRDKENKLDDRWVNNFPIIDTRTIDKAKKDGKKFSEVELPDSE